MQQTDLNIFGLPLFELQELVEDYGGKKFVASQIYSWLYKNLETDVEKWTNVSKVLKEKLAPTIELPRILWKGVSSDGTRKFLIGFKDFKSVETVLIPAKGRLTICLSSQVGCAIGCTFCHTGTMGLTRNLTAAEIVGQFMAITYWLKTQPEQERISNIVFMGQGEPLHNFDNVKSAIKVFMEDFGLGLGQRKITVSTSGLVPQIMKLTDFPPVNIAISLHAAHDNVRTELMPINKAYDLRRLFDAIKNIPLKAHRWITYEYILIDGLNDRQEDIDALVQLLNKKESKINIIPFNEYPDSRFKRPSNQKLKWFSEGLNSRGIITTIRQSKGQDILAACGQLKSEIDGPNLWSQSGQPNP